MFQKCSSVWRKILENIRRSSSKKSPLDQFDYLPFQFVEEYSDRESQHKKETHATSVDGRTSQIDVSLKTGRPRATRMHTLKKCWCFAFCHVMWHASVPYLFSISLSFTSSLTHSWLHSAAYTLVTDSFRPLLLFHFYHHHHFIGVVFFKSQFLLDGKQFALYLEFTVKW